ncbi:MAG TPA: hypothetical protein DEB12_07455 [Porphyromonadaceae bacterium]|nr:hypothetical protein [Porphyromonadaceae bacterium]
MKSNFMKTRLLKNGLLALASVVMLWGAVSCESDNDDFKNGKATVRFSLTDAPAFDYDEVNIDIIGVSVGVADDEMGEGGWFDLNMPEPGVFDLLKLRNGETVLLAGGDIPAGDITQVRLLLGDGSNVVVDGEPYSLFTPSAYTSGLKLNLHQTLEADMAYNFTLDFDAARSVVKQGNGRYSLKPVIKAFADEFGATIKGVALPAKSVAPGVSHVQIISAENDTLISLPDEETGKFLFFGLKPSVWDLTVVADTSTTYLDAVIEGIVVEQGDIEDLEVIELQTP